MATSDFWQRVSASVVTADRQFEGTDLEPSTVFRGSTAFWIAMDLATIVVSVFIATLIDLNTTPLEGAEGFWHGTLIHGRSMWILLGLLCWFSLSLIITSRRLHLYNPARLPTYLNEQRLSVQACFTSGLLLTGLLYLTHASDIPRGIVLVTVVLVTIALSLRRFIYRMVLYQRLEQGIGARNVLIVGTGPEAHALRHHIQSIQHLGYTFKGFVELPGSSLGSSAGSSRLASTSGDVVGSIESLFQDARRLFVDEIFFTTSGEQGLIQKVLEQARVHGVDLRMIPNLYDGLAWNSPIEYVGQFPTIPLHRGYVPESALLMKRMLDVLLVSLGLVVLSPILLVIAIAIKLDSPGPVMYGSERIGKKGRVFRCFKFRTMMNDADKRRAEMLHMNERDGVLFKISNDPRITRIGRCLRKYSLDEMPQFLNVLLGDMSLVGPRPPLASEVREYKLSHLRRLDVTPGVTGLWQVQARQDPSFDSYISLDVAYIENWSLWLDIKIIVRTVGVVFSGTGS